MKFLPGIFDDWARGNNWTKGEKIAYISMNYLDVATYGFLVIFAVRNIWVILYK